MEYFQKILERFFTWSGRALEEVPREWERHVSRRATTILLLTGCVLITMYVTLIRPPNAFPKNELVSVPAGASLSETATMLKEQHVILSSTAFALFMRLSGHERDVHAGDYLFRKPRNMFVVARALALGEYGLEPTRIRVPEGSTVKEMAGIFGAELQRFDEKRFVANATEYEGYLFPDTYFFLPNANDELVLTTLRQSFDLHTKSLSSRIVAFGKPLKDIVIMASILEREAQTMEDRRMIAGVLWNRIQRGMFLQVDATFLYTLRKDTFDLTMSDLANKDDPYNTYAHKGLPPGPIGSPSMDALLAVVTPIKSDYLFYLASHDNVTHYTKTYEEHLANKKKYLGN